MYDKETMDPCVNEPLRPNAEIRYLANGNLGEQQASLEPLSEEMQRKPDFELLEIKNILQSIKTTEPINHLENQTTLEGHYDGVLSLSFSPDGKFLASGSSDNTVIIWNVAENKIEFSLPTHTSIARSVSFSPDGKFLAIGLGNNTVKLWDIAQSKEEVLSGHSRAVTSVNFSPGGNFLASGSEDTTVKLWKLVGDRRRDSLEKHTSVVNAVSFCPNYEFLASGSADSTVILWKIALKRPLFTLEGHTKAVHAVSFSPDGKLLASGSGDSTVKLWNLAADNREELTLQGHNDEVTALSFTPNGNLLASGSQDKKVKLWNLAERREEFTLKGHSNSVNAVSFSPDGKFLASGSQDKAVKLWNLSEKNEEFTHKGRENKGNAVVFSPDGKFKASRSEEKTITVWNVDDETKEFAFEVNAYEERSFSFSPDGKHFAYGSVKNTVNLYNLIEMNEKFTFTGHSATVTSVRFSPDGRLLASGSKDKTVKLWTLNNKSCKTIDPRSFTAVSSVNFSPDGKNLVVLYADSTIYALNIKTFKPFLRMSNQSSKLYTFSFLESGILKFSKRFSYDFSLYDQNGKEIKIGRSPFEDCYHTSDLESVNNPRLNPLKLFINAISNIKNNEYSTIANWNVIISNNNYTPLHFAAYERKTDEVKANLKLDRNITIKADAFGRSPLFYSIKQQCQSITDLILQYLVDLAQDETKPFIIRLGSFFAIRNDLPLIIKNSSENLCDFLSLSLYFSSEKQPAFGIASRKATLIGSFGVNDKDLIKESKEGAKPLKVKVSYFDLPSSYGTKLSIELLESFLECSQKDIFKVQLINAYIKYKWNDFFYYTLSFPLLEWANLILFATYFTNDFQMQFYSIIGLLMANSALMTWEIMQFKVMKWKYFLDYWNIVDFIRSIATIAFISFYFLNISVAQIEWCFTLLNILRGVTGFKAFAQSRFYIQLIVQSIKKVAPFFLIFMYTILCFGLLRIVAINEYVGFDTLWMQSFMLVIGNSDAFQSEGFDLLTVTFMAAVFLNLILMLNMLISILGDSFDEVQTLQVYYDNKEMCETMLEIENVLSLIKSVEIKKFLHVCTGFYNDMEEGLWAGRAVDTRALVEKSIEQTQNHFNKKLNEVERKLNKKIAEVDENIKAVQGNFKEINEKLDTLIKGLGK